MLQILCNTCWSEVYVREQDGSHVINKLIYAVYSKKQKNYDYVFSILITIP